MNKTRIAVIGTGHLGSKHAKIYQEIPECCLVGVCDIDKDRLKQISSDLGVEGYANYQELINKVDAVSVATPTNLHYKIASYFLNRGIHTLVEKPFTPDLKQADTLIKLAQKNSLILQVGHIERFNSAFTATQKLIKEPKFIECHRLSPFPNRSLDIGVVLDLMIHDIDIVLGLVNSPVKKIEAVGVKVLSAFEDIANARINFMNGCVCNLTASRVSDEWMRKIRIFLENAYISLDYKNEEAFIYKKTGLGISKVALPIEKEQPLKRELTSFVDCIARNTPPLVSGEVARQALSVALTIKKLIWKNSRKS
jgi:predicted dehydrogenase